MMPSFSACHAAKCEHLLFDPDARGEGLGGYLCTGIKFEMSNKVWMGLRLDHLKRCPIGRLGGSE